MGFVSAVLGFIHRDVLTHTSSLSAGCVCVGVSRGGFVTAKLKS